MARLETALQEIQAENKLNKFKEEFLFLNLQAPFKLKGKGNYHDWSIEMESIALMLEAKPILKDTKRSGNLNPKLSSASCTPGSNLP